MEHQRKVSPVIFGCTLVQDRPERAGSRSCSCGCRRCTPLNRRQQHEAGEAGIARVLATVCTAALVQCRHASQRRSVTHLYRRKGITLHAPPGGQKRRNALDISFHRLQLGLAQLPVYSANRIYHFQCFQSAQAI